MAGKVEARLKELNLAVPGAPAAVANYVPFVKSGNLVFVSGQLPIEPSGAKLVGAPFEAQAAQVLANVEAALRGAGSDKQRLLQVRVYLTDIDQWPAFNALYARWLGDHRPARAVVPVPLLHFGFLIEVEATALL